VSISRDVVGEIEAPARRPIGLRGSTDLGEAEARVELADHVVLGRRDVFCDQRPRAALPRRLDGDIHRFEFKLSAEHAATHIERNTIGSGRGWHWQGNWTDLYCIALEDPKDPGTLRQIEDPYLERRARAAKRSKGLWSRVLIFSR